jgi:hypothetical protein
MDCNKRNTGRWFDALTELAYDEESIVRIGVVGKNEKLK